MSSAAVDAGLGHRSKGDSGGYASRGAETVLVQLALAETG